MGKLAETQERLQEHTDRRRAAERSLADIDREISQLRGVIASTVDATELVEAQSRLDALETARERLTEKLRYAVALEKQHEDYLESFELRVEHSQAAILDHARTIALLEKHAKRIREIKGELDEMRIGLAWRYSHQLRENIIGLGSNILADYDRAVLGKAACEQFLADAGVEQ